MDFGINGAFINEKISHDELDAITCAIAGLFFWAGRFEALGLERESKLIVPDPRANNDLWNKRRAIAISGLSGAGKTTVAIFLKTKRFQIRNSRDTVMRMAGICLNAGRQKLQEAGWKPQSDGKQRALMLKIIEGYEVHPRMAIDCMRFLEGRATLLEAFGPGLAHIHIECGKNERCKRIRARDNFSDERQHPVEGEILELGKKAHFNLSNEGSKSEIEAAVAGLLATQCL